jgi:DNA-binding PadR family transcriptional regulator
METRRIKVASQNSEAKLIKKIHKRLVKSNLDIILLAELRTKTFSGYDAISFIQSKYGYFISSGTVYSLFYSLEREGFVEGFWDERKRVYKLTDKGKETIETILKANNQISVLAKNLLSIP